MSEITVRSGTPYRMLEIGPGSNPLAKYFDYDLSEHNWIGFPNCEYTAIQPSPHGNFLDNQNKFPDECLAMPNVRYIKGYVETVELPEESFDEVFAGNVFSEPGVARYTEDILLSIIRLLKRGGKFTAVDTYTPELALLSPAYITERFAGRLSLIASYGTDIPRGPQFTDEPINKWSRLVMPYSYATRLTARINRPFSRLETGTFQQYKRI